MSTSTTNPEGNTNRKAMLRLAGAALILTLIGLGIWKFTTNESGMSVSQVDSFVVVFDAKRDKAPHSQSAVGYNSNLIAVGERCLGVKGPKGKVYIAIWQRGTRFETRGQSIIVHADGQEWRLGDVNAFAIESTPSLTDLDLPDECAGHRGAILADIGLAP